MDNESVSSNTGLEVSFLKQKLGINERFFLANDESALDLAERASRAAVEHESQDIGALFFVTQNPTQGIPHDSALLHARLGLGTDVACVDLGLACTGFVHGLLLAEAWVKMLRSKSALLVTSDCYSRIMDPTNRSVAGLFGDAAAAILLSDAGEWNVLPGNFGIISRSSQAIRVEPATPTTEVIRNSQGEQITFERNVSLQMDGRTVLTAAMRYVPEAVRSTLDSFDLSFQDIDLFVFHQGSGFMVEQLRLAMQLPEEKVALALEASGNCVSSSIPIALEKHFRAGDSGKINRILVCGFGVGFSWSTAILERKLGGAGNDVQN